MTLKGLRLWRSLLRAKQHKSESSSGRLYGLPFLLECEWFLYKELKGMKRKWVVGKFGMDLAENRSGGIYG